MSIYPLSRRLLASILSICFFAHVASAEPFAYSVKTSGEETSLYRIDLGTGAATPIGSTGFSRIGALTFDAAGEVLYGYDESSDSLVRINTQTGAGTVVGASGISVFGTGMSSDCEGNLWLTASTDEPNGGRFYRLDPETGAATLIGQMGNTGGTGLATQPGSRTLFGITYGSQTELFTLNKESGAATAIGQLQNVEVFGGGLDFDSAGTLWGISEFPSSESGLSSASQIFTVDPSTGVATVTGSVQYCPAATLPGPVPTPIPGACDVDGFQSLAIEGGLVCNTSPICNAGESYSISVCSSSGEKLTLQGANSSDAENDPLTFAWSTDCSGASLANPSSSSPILSLSPAAPKGICSANLAVSDGVDTAQCSAPISVNACPCVVTDLTPAVDGIIKETVDIVRLFRRSSYIRYVINQRPQKNPLVRELVRVKLIAMLNKLRDVAKSSLATSSFDQCGLTVQCALINFSGQKSSMLAVVSDFQVLIKQLNGPIDNERGLRYRSEQRRLLRRTNARLKNLGERISQYPDTVRSNCSGIGS